MNSTSPSNPCPQCGKPVPAGSPLGLCPECLLLAGVPTQPASGATTREARGARFQPPEPAALAPFFPQLEILELVGQGGMGAVYQARQPALDRLVALKILRPPSDGDPAFAERFAREARALARLSHPNIVGVHDFGQAGGFHFLLMEFVDGTNLRHAMQAGQMAPREALAIVPPLCDALQYAHDRGIVHRDIKPENILLTREGVVKVADFGLAKLVGVPGAAVDAALTGIGDVMGTPHYMAPEQVEHPQAVDHRADIYSLGVVFYQMLTGELPLGRFAPPSARIAGMRIDVRLDEIVLRTLEKEPERRYQQASEVKTEVETVSAGSPPPPVPAPMPADTTEEDFRCAELVRLPATLLAGAFLGGLALAVPGVALVGGVFSAGALGKVGAAEAAFGVFMVLYVICGFAVAGFGAWASLRARSLRGYSTAMGAAVGGIVAVLFLNVLGLLSAAAGVWLLVVLMRADVRAAFRRHPDGLRHTGRRSPQTRIAVLILGGLMVLLVGFLVLVLAQRLKEPRAHAAPAISAPAVERDARPEEYRDLVRSLVNRHAPGDAALLLPGARDALALEKARYDAGIGDGDAIRDAQLQVDLVSAELAGANDNDLLALRLKAARDRLVVIEARNAAGVADPEVLSGVQGEVALLEAVLSGDVVAPFLQIVEQRTRRLKLAEERFAAGLAVRADVDRARVQLDLALNQLARVKSGQ